MAAGQAEGNASEGGLGLAHDPALAHVQLLKAPQVADVLGISRSTLDRYVKQERVPQPIRLSGGARRWRLRDIERFVGVEGNV